MAIEDILDEIYQYDCNLVEITGGEPLIQQETHELIKNLREQEYTILLETNGSRNLEKIPSEVIKIIDWKTPGSGEDESFIIHNLDYLTGKDEIKFVISDNRDYQWSKDRMRDHKITDRCKVLMSPVKGKFAPEDLCELILKDNLNVRFQLQLHKYIWPKDKRGR